MKIKNKFVDGACKGTIYFMSDLHFNHFNAIHHGSRPFKNLEEMNSEVLGRIRETLKPEDVLFDLGDLFWKTESRVIEAFLKNIPCPMYKIVGNHDSEEIWWGSDLASRRIQGMVERVADILDIKVVSKEGETYMLTLSHYPILSWNHRHYGSINLHGHCHGNIDTLNKESQELRIDLGWDGEMAKSLGTFLIPWTEIEKKIKEITNNRTNKPEIL